LQHQGSDIYRGQSLAISPLAIPGVPTSPPTEHLSA
jgi:hypothetical protein